MASRCDLIIRNGTVFDGTGAPRFNADVAITGDRITAVGELGRLSAAREIIATGKAVAPGFIDAHTHDDRAVLCGPICMLCKMSQGVTTVVVGNCGISLSPVRMTSRPPPPLDLLGGEAFWTFDSFASYAEQLARDPFAGQYLRVDWSHVAARRRNERRYCPPGVRERGAAHARPVDGGVGPGCIGVFDRPILPTQYACANR